MKFKNRRDLINYLKELNFKVGVEIGVKEGYFSKYMLENTDMKIYSIDPWEYNSLLLHPVQAYEQAKKLLNPFGERSIMIKAYSPEICRDFQENSIDFVYIDGIHTYDAVKADIDGWYNKIKIGGIISGHDYSKERWVGVINAVDEFVEKNQLVLNLTGENGEYDGHELSWWVLKNN